MYIEQLEAGFDFLNKIVASGDKLTSVQLVDDQGVIDLPIEAFDGSSVMELIEWLESQWKVSLAQPAFTTVELRVSISALINLHLTVCESKITRIRPLFNRAEILLLRSKEMKRSHHNQTLEKTYQATLSFYQNQLDRAYANRERLLKAIDRSINGVSGYPV